MTGTVVDTSALLAILFREKTSETVFELLAARTDRLMSAATRVELGLVAEARLGPRGADIVDRFLRDAAVQVVPCDAETAARALSAWRRFGKGRHPAALSFGDCFSFATAEQYGMPLLCVGDDFPATDLDLLHPGADPPQVRKT